MARKSSRSSHLRRWNPQLLGCSVYSSFYDDSDTSCSFSGPKGVINDWRKYKQLEVEQKQEQKKEMERLIKKLSMTCRSDLDLEKDKEKEKALQDKIKGKVSTMGTIL